MAGNQTFGRYMETDGAAGWLDFDRLPREIREIIDVAPFKLCVGERRRRYLKELREGGSAATYRRALIEECCERIMEAAQRTYGPTHPDAQRSRLRLLRRRERAA